MANLPYCRLINENNSKCNNCVYIILYGKLFVVCVFSVFANVQHTKYMPSAERSGHLHIEYLERDSAIT
jgi:hypothetical protein